MGVGSMCSGVKIDGSTVTTGFWMIFGGTGVTVGATGATGVEIGATETTGVGFGATVAGGTGIGGATAFDAT